AGGGDVPGGFRAATNRVVALRCAWLAGVRPPRHGADGAVSSTLGRLHRLAVAVYMSPMRSPRDFLKPLALGAPEPVREIPVTPSRSIHFFDPSNEKMAAKLPDLAREADILLGNLEGAIPADKKIAAREGLVRVGREVDLGSTPLWTRVNSLDSPWCLDDLTTLVGAIGNRLDVVMIPKVEGPWDIH